MQPEVHSATRLLTDSKAEEVVESGRREPAADRTGRARLGLEREGGVGEALVRFEINFYTHTRTRTRTDTHRHERYLR